MTDIPETSLNQHSTLVSMMALVVDALESYGLDYRAVIKVLKVSAADRRRH